MKKTVPILRWGAAGILLLALALLAGLLARSAYPASPADPNLNPPGTLPVCKETDTLRIAITQSFHVLSYDYGKNKLTTWLQDRTNVEAKFVFYPPEDALSRLEADLSSGGDPGDLILIPLDRVTLYQYGSQGALLPLNRLIKQYGQNIRACLDAFDGSRTAITAPDGNIYALPQGNLTDISPNAYAMRHWILTDFLDQYTAATGKAMPATTDEYHAYLTWCVNNDPNGNGRTDEVGWTGAENPAVWYARPTDFLMNAFTLTDQNGYYQKDDTIHCAMVEAGYRSGLEYLTQLMADGLMDPNYPSNDEKAIKTLVALEGGRTVASISCGGMHNAASDHAIRNAYQIVAPLQGPDGLANAFYDQYSTGVTPGKATVPATSRNAELAVAWMDAMYDQEVAFWGRFGEEGVNWVVPPVGTVAVDGGPALYRTMRNVLSPTLKNWFSVSPGMWDRYDTYDAEPQPATDANGNPIHDLTKSLYNAARLYTDFVTPCSVPPFWYDVDTAVQTEAWRVSIDKYCRAVITDYILGRRDIHDDAEWASYVAGARALGLDDYLDAMQAEYDDHWQGTLPEEVNQ